jgi:hypothetical protein
LGSEQRAERAQNRINQRRHERYSPLRIVSIDDSTLPSRLDKINNIKDYEFSGRTTPILSLPAVL